MREIATSVLRELKLDYLVTFVSGGASRNYEIVMWDKPHNTYFSIRFAWEPDTTRETVRARIKTQICERLACFARGQRQFGERTPTAPPVSSSRPRSSA